MRGFLLGLILLLGACSAEGPESHDYQIVVNGSTTPVPVEFTGSYACQTGDEELVTDISGTGTLTTSFRCERLLYVRIQRVLGVGLVSLTVYTDGEAVFTTTPTDSAVPIVYVP